MSSVTLSLSIVERIVKVHECAADRADRQPVLGGVFLQFSSPELVIAATDGRLLIEEAWPVSLAPGTSMIVAAASVGLLDGFCKSVRKQNGKKGHDPVVTLSIETDSPTRRTISACALGSVVTLSLVEEKYPSYIGALTRDSYATTTICLNSDYLSRLNKLWATKQNKGLMMAFKRGVHVSPLTLADGAIRQRGLLMPILVPV